MVAPHPPQQPFNLGGRDRGRMVESAQGSRVAASALSCLRSQHPPRLCWECEAGGLWGQQAPADHLHVRHGHALGHWHTLLDEP